jgi:hypothetical protein
MSIGPQKGPSSIAMIAAQTKHMLQELGSYCMTKETWEFLKKDAASVSSGDTPLFAGVRVSVFDTEEECRAFIAQQAIIRQKVTLVKK